jgi:hypothetical protein
MKRHVPGLHLGVGDNDGVLEGLFLVRIDRASYRWHQKKPFFALRFSVLDPQESAGQVICGRLYCTPKALWKLNWFLRDFGYDDDLFERDEVDERALFGLKGVLRTSSTTRGRRVFQNLDAFAPAGEWAVSSIPTISDKKDREISIGL